MNLTEKFKIFTVNSFLDPIFRSSITDFPKHIFFQDKCFRMLVKMRVASEISGVSCSENL